MKDEEFGIFERHADLPGDVRVLNEDREGRLWIGTGGGLFRWDGKSLQAFARPGGQPAEPVNDLLAEPDGSIMVGWAEGEPLRWDGSAFQRVFVPGQFPAANGVRSLVRDASGLLWCGLLNGGLIRLNGDGSLTTSEQRIGLPAATVVRSLFLDRAGKLLAGTSGGLYEFLGTGFVRSETIDSLVTGDIHDLFQDAEGSLLVASEQGAMLLSGESVRTFRSLDGLSVDDARCLLLDRQGVLWIGSDSGGLSRIREGRLDRISLRSTDPAQEPPVISLEQRKDGSMAVGTGKGVFLVSEGQSRPAPEGWHCSDQAIRAIIEDRQGNVWLGGETLGLAVIQPDGTRRTFPAGVKPPSGAVRALLEDATDGVWVGTDDGLTLVQTTKTTNFGKAEGLPHKAVQTLMRKEDGSIWIGTAGGLARWKDGRMKAWTVDDGLRDERIFSMVDDRAGGLWISCPAGVFWVRFSELEMDLGSKDIPIVSAMLGPRHGIIGGTFKGGSQPAGALGRDGELYFPSPSGLVVLDPRVFKVPSEAPRVVIDRLEFNNSRVRLRDGEYRISPGRGLLAIKFSALSFKDSLQNRFRYRLEGFDSDWVTVNLRRDTLYTNLAPGPYRFQVIACNSDGVWNREGVTAMIRVLPFYHQTLWFRAGVGMLTIFLLGLGYWYRVRLLRQQQRALAEQVEDRTRDLRREIDQRLKTEEQLRRTSELLSRAFRASPVPMMLCRLDDGRVVEGNPGLAELTGRSLEGMISQTDTDLGLWPSAAEREAVFSEIRAGRTVRNREFIFKSPRGARQLLLSAEHFELPSGRHVLFVVLDITDRSVLQQQLHRLQKVEAIGTLAAGIAHDFNNLLTIIGGHVSLILDVSALAEEDRDALEQVRTAVNRAAKLTQQLLAYSRRQQLDVRPFQLNSLVVRLTGLLGPVMGEMVRVIHRLDPVSPPVVGDEHQIEQVVINMAVNARDAMPRGGELRLSTDVVEMLDTAKLRDSEALPGRYVRLTVEDTGTGMDEATLARVFEPFFTTKEVGRGTGLGLATAFGIVKQHQGWIDVRSELGRGSTFELFLPAGTPAKDHSVAPASKERDPVGGECVLVAEDEPSVRHFVTTVLARKGFRVLSAESGPEALKVARSHEGKIDLLLTDFVMPDGMTGRELADELLKERTDLKVIISTGYSTELVGLRTVQDLTIIRKPFEADDLLRVIRLTLRG